MHGRIFLKFYLLLPAFLDTGLPIGNGFERNSYVPCKVPSLPNLTTRRVWTHHRSLRPLLFSNSGVGSFTSHKNRSVKVLWDGTYGFSSLSEKTRKSNHLQMSLQRQHFLLSYLKTMSVSPVGVWTRDLPLGALPTELTRQQYRLILLRTLLWVFLPACKSFPAVCLKGETIEPTK